MNLGDFRLRVPIHDLGKFNPAWKGIYSPLYDDSFVRKYIHDQFLEGSDTYIEKYQNFSLWAGYLELAHRFLSLEHEQALHIVDIGSGSGNTVFPLLDHYPNAQIIASDLSLPLLKALKDRYDLHYHSNNCFIVQLNAEDMIFEHESVDLIVGGAILHHLFDPSKTLAECYKTLKPGGAAVFFEPFEVGNQIVSIIFENLIQLDEMYAAARRMHSNHWIKRFVIKNDSGSQTEAIPSNVISFFKAWCFDLKARQGSDKSDPKYQNMDDKWLFTRQYFEDIKNTMGFKELVIFPLRNNTQMPFFDQINVYLKIVFSMDISELPGWAINRIHEFDDHFSQELRQDLMTEGGIILIK